MGRKRQEVGRKENVSEKMLKTLSRQCVYPQKIVAGEGCLLDMFVSHDTGILDGDLKSCNIFFCS